MQSAMHLPSSACATSIYPRHPRESGELCGVINMSSFEYASPRSVEEALGILSSRPEAQPLAGGQKLLLGRNRNRPKGMVLVDLGHIPSLREIHTQDGSLRIGAMATLNEIAGSDLVGKYLPT